MLGLTPFKAFLPKFYIGNIRVGTPYFLPRVWRPSKEKDGYLVARPRKFGFDFVGIGWKTKWSDKDIRHEFNPVWSFVIWKWQIALIFRPDHDMHYYEALIYWDRFIREEFKEGLTQALFLREEFTLQYTVYQDDEKSKVDYYDYILKEKYL